VEDPCVETHSSRLVGTPGRTPTQGGECTWCTDETSAQHQGGPPHTHLEAGLLHGSQGSVDAQTRVGLDQIDALADVVLGERGDVAGSGSGLQKRGWEGLGEGEGGKPHSEGAAVTDAQIDRAHLGLDALQAQGLQSSGEVGTLSAGPVIVVGFAFVGVVANALVAP